MTLTLTAPVVTDAELVDAVLATVTRLSLREAAREVGVDHQRIARWRRGRDRPGGWTYLEDSTRAHLQEYLARACDTRVTRGEALSEEEQGRAREILVRLPHALSQGRSVAAGLAEELTRLLRGV